MTDHDGAREGEITALLQDAAAGDRNAFDRLLPLVYEELNRLAHRKLRLERVGHTLDTGALVHEAYLKLAGQTRIAWANRQHFFAVASEAMRRILIDYAKRHRAEKRGGGVGHLELEAADALTPIEPLFTDDQAAELIALDDALQRLAVFNPQGARIVQYRFFGGLEHHEVANVLGVSERTVRRSWFAAKGWLRRELADTLGAGSSGLLSPDPG